MRYVHERTQQPLQTEEVDQFIEWLLDEAAIAKRKGTRGKRQKEPLMGKYECLQGKWAFLRGSNFCERLYVGLEASLQAGRDPKAAHITLAELPYVKKHLGRSKRGQRSRRRVLSLDRRIETIRSLCNRFKSPFKDKLVEMRVGEYRRFQIHQDEIAERERIAQLMHKLISEGICVPCSPVHAPPDPDS
jgi:hypothetical protein